MRSTYQPTLVGSLGLLALRAAVGVGLICHGYDTLFTGDPVGVKLDGFVEHVVNGALHMPQPELMGKVAKWTELAGGGLLVLGLLTRLSALALTANMGVAIYFHMLVKSDAFFVSPGTDAGSWELPALYFGGALAILCLGPGSLSVDRIVAGGGGADEAEDPEG